MTPHSLAFYVDVVTTGAVLGARPGDPPDRVTALLGPEFAENVLNGRTMWRDYGLTEFHWTRARADRPWTGHHLSVQLHRLARVDRTLPDPALRARYGRFAPRLPFAKLQRLLARRGVPLLEEAGFGDPHFRTFRRPRTGVTVTVVGSHGRYSTPAGLRAGDVYGIQCAVVGY